mgnify:CR=1 FL=1
MGLGTFLSGYIILLRECERKNYGKIFLRGVDSSPEVRRPREWFAGVGRRVRFTSTADKKTATAPTNVNVGVCTGRILPLRTARVNRTDCGGCFVESATSELLTASGSSLRLCGGGGNDVAGRNRLPRQEGGKDTSRYFESGSGSLARFCRGEIRSGFGALAFFAVAGVWQTSGRRGDVVGGGTGINVPDFHVFDLSPGASIGRGAQVKETGGPVPSRERLHKGEGEDARRRRARTRRRRANTHTHFFSFILRVGDPGRFLFPPFQFPTPIGRMRSKSNSSL